MAEREGFEPSEASSQLAEDEDSEYRCRSQSSPISSLTEGNLSPELGEIVASWPFLSPEIRAAILTILRSVRKEVEP